MHAVVGTWETDPELAETRRRMLEHIVEGVRRAPGFVQGYWADSSAFQSHTFIVFSDRPSAEAFEADVRANVANQVRAGVTSKELHLAEIVAST